MHALIVDHANGPLRRASVPRPDAASGEVLVKIAAAGLNPLDAKIRSGNAPHAQHPFPAVLGIDMAGTIVALGSEVAGFSVGDAVYGMTGGVGNLQGSLAQYAAVDPALLALKPRNLSMREAAALPLAFVTAYAALVDRARSAVGQTVLVQGGAGGVGFVAVQLALALGARVFATASCRDLKLLESLGVTAIDYREEAAPQYVARLTQGTGFDVVFDTVGGATLDASFAAVKHFGHVVSALGWGTHSLAPLSFREASYSGVFTLQPLLSGQGRAHHGEMLREATRLVQAGKLKPRLDARYFDLPAAEAAYEALAAGSSQGKLIVEVT